MAQALLIILLSVGGIGLILLMPGSRLSLPRAALILSLAVAAALVGLALRGVGDVGGRSTLAVLALIGVFGAVRLITHSHPVYSALYFILVAVATAGMLVLMQAEFVAAALLIIYGGAILVTYVFVIMLAQQSGGPRTYDRYAREPLVGVLAGFILLTVIAARLFGSGADVAASPPEDVTRASGAVLPVGTHLLTQYVIAVQLAAVILTAAMVGAIAVARRRPVMAEEGE